MEKILLLLDPHQPEEKTIDFACNVARTTNGKLVGLLIENAYLEYSPVVLLETVPYYGTHPQLAKKMLQDRDLQPAMDLFRKACEKEGIAYSIKHDKGDPLEEVLFESRFADLIIANPVLHYFEGADHIPSHFVKQLLAHAECPVLLAPEECGYIDEVILCYNGSASSMAAMRQFTCVMPEFHDCPVRVLEVTKEKRPEFNQGHRNLMEWLKLHYKSVRYEVVEGQAPDELFNHLLLKRDKMVVIGAYGGSILHKLFRKSTAEKLIRNLDLPIFITHH